MMFSGELATKFDQKVRLHFFREFVNFIQKYGIISLATAVVIGQAVNRLVANFTEGIITPFIKLIINPLVGFVDPIFGKTFAQQDFTKYEAFGFKIGSFINSFLEFAITLLFIYLVIRFLIIYLMTDEEKAKILLQDKLEKVENELEKQKLEEQIQSSKKELKIKKKKREKSV